MSRFDLLYEIKHALSRAIDLDDLMAALFADHPELNKVEYSVTNEYDDNNYSDYCRLYKANGWNVDYDGEIEHEDDQDEELDESTKPSAGAVSDAMTLSEYVQDKHGYGEHTFERSDYKLEGSERRTKNNPSFDCAVALLNGSKLPVERVIEADGRWVVRYAKVHGRYTPEDEFKAFARDGMMGLALEYSKSFGPLSEKTLNWFVLSSHKESSDHHHLQEYLEWVKAA